MTKRLFLSPPHLGCSEFELVQKAFSSNYIAPLGPMVDAFERAFAEYTGIRHCLALSSGTAAMHLALRELGVGLGDEVLVSTLTFIGSVSPVTFLGGRPVFIDSDRASWNMNPALLKAELERCAVRDKLPKAVVPTDLYGQCCDYDQITDICDRYGVPVVIDAAEAMGAQYNSSKNNALRHAGSGVQAAIFSFNGNKIMTTSGGGMLAADNPERIEHARFLSQQAREPFPHYEHKKIGYNYRMSNILAAIGRGQLQVLDERVQQKRALFEYYRNTLGDLDGIEFMPEASYSHPNHWLTVILITPEAFGANREDVRLALEAENIESRPVWKPMHLQPAFSPDRPDKNKEVYACRVVGGEVSEDIFERGLCLPSGTAMTNADLERIVSVIRNCFQP